MCSSAQKNVSISKFLFIELQNYIHISVWFCFSSVLYGPAMGEEQVPSGLVDAVDSLKEALKAGRTDIFRKLLDACQTGKILISS